MLKKQTVRSREVVKVTFTVPQEELPQDVEVETLYVVGEFNDWDPAAHPLRERKDGRFSTTVSLQSGRIYRFKYLVEAKYWENDSAADAYIQNAFGTEDSIVKV